MVELTSSQNKKTHPKMSLLEGLRKKLVDPNIMDPTTDREAEQKMNLILRHQSEFPAKLRVAIREAAGEQHPSEEPSELLTYHVLPFGEEAATSGISGFLHRFRHKKHPPPRKKKNVANVFLQTVYEAIKVFFLGVMWKTHDSYWLLAWHGLDREVDTEDEAELAIRCFPEILTQTAHLERTGLHWALPIHMLLTHSRRVSFVPLFAQLGAELGRFPASQKGGLALSHMNVVGQLVCNGIADIAENSRSHYKGRPPSTERVDEESLAVLMRLRDKGLVTKEDIRAYGFELIIDLFEAASYRSIGYIERRLQLLIDWNPSLLVGSHVHLLHAYCCWNQFLVYDDTNVRFCEERVEIRLFEVLCELGMFYFPLQLGFLFHKTIFPQACQRMGSQTVTEIFNDKLVRNVGNGGSDGSGNHKMTMQTLVIAAATNEEISLDGIYSLIRCDPTIALIPQFSAATRR